MINHQQINGNFFCSSHLHFIFFDFRSLTPKEKIPANNLKELAQKEFVVDTVIGVKKNKPIMGSNDDPRDIAKKEVVVDNIFSLFGSVVNKDLGDLHQSRKLKSSSAKSLGRRKSKVTRSESVPTPQKTRYT